MEEPGDSGAGRGDPHPRQGRPPDHDRRRLQHRRPLSRQPRILPTRHRAGARRNRRLGKGLRAVGGASGPPNIASLADLYAVAYQIEADAVERYELLAAQMEVHNNPDLAALFRDLARAEGIHRDEILRLAGEAGES